MSTGFPIPGARVPVLQPDGTMNPAWYTALRFLASFASFDGSTVTLNGGLIVPASVLAATNQALTNDAAAQTATLTNAPSAGNPTKWARVNDNGTIRRVPLW